MLLEVVVVAEVVVDEVEDEEEVRVLVDEEVVVTPEEPAVADVVWLPLPPLVEEVVLALFVYSRVMPAATPITTMMIISIAAVVEETPFEIRIRSRKPALHMGIQGLVINCS